MAHSQFLFIFDSLIVALPLESSPKYVPSYKSGTCRTVKNEAAKKKNENSQLIIEQEFHLPSITAQKFLKKLIALLRNMMS